MTMREKFVGCGNPERAARGASGPGADSRGRAGKVRSACWLLRLAVLSSVVALGGCENPEDAARRVKEPFSTVQAGDMLALDSALTEAETRLLSVRAVDLRAELSEDVAEEYGRLRARFVAIHQARAAEEAARVEREREVAQQARAEEQRREATRLAEQRRQRERQAVIDLEAITRTALMCDGLVLQLRNAQPIAVDFDLRCYTRDESSYKTLFVRVPARGQTELGCLQGWTYWPGQRCEAWLHGRQLWDLRIAG